MNRNGPTDNIIAIETRLAEAPPVERLRERWDSCRHDHTVLNDTERRVTCRDCGASLEAYDVLVKFANQWDRWRAEADQLREYRADYHRIEREKWDRARDRHIGANPTHRIREGATSWNWDEPHCRICYRIEVRWDHRWTIRRGPKPPSGPLTGDETVAEIVEREAASPDTRSGQG